MRHTRLLSSTRRLDERAHAIHMARQRVPANLSALLAARPRSRAGSLHVATQRGDGQALLHDIKRACVGG